MAVESKLIEESLLVTKGTTMTAFVVEVLEVSIVFHVLVEPVDCIRLSESGFAVRNWTREYHTSCSTSKIVGSAAINLLGGWWHVVGDRC